MIEEEKVIIKKRFLEMLKECYNATRAAKELPVEYATLYHWRRTDEEFAKGWMDALQCYCDRIEMEVSRRGVDGWDEPIYQNGELVGHKRKYSDQLLMSLAKARIPAFRDKTEADITINGAVMAVPIQDLSDDEFERITKK